MAQIHPSSRFICPTLPIASPFSLDAASWAAFLAYIADRPAVSDPGQQKYNFSPNYFFLDGHH
jgi:hypothetical protein